MLAFSQPCPSPLLGFTLWHLCLFLCLPPQSLSDKIDSQGGDSKSKSTASRGYMKVGLWLYIPHHCPKCHWMLADGHTSMLLPDTWLWMGHLVVLQCWSTRYEAHPSPLWVVHHYRHQFLQPSSQCLWKPETGHFILLHGNVSPGDLPVICVLDLRFAVTKPEEDSVTLTCPWLGRSHSTTSMLHQSDAVAPLPCSKWGWFTCSFSCSTTT